MPYVEVQAPRAKELIIIRGLPGAGKSTLAKHLMEVYNKDNPKHYEADMYFMSGGEYVWNPNKLKDAHNWCFNSVEDALTVNTECKTVIVSNTFTTFSEIEKYMLLAAQHNADIRIIDCVSQFKSIHNVPEEAMERMRKRMVSNEYIVDKFKEMFNIEHDAPGFEISHQRYSRGI